MSGHAEIAQVWPRDGRIRLVGALHGERPAPGTAKDWRLLVVLRDGDATEREYPAPLDGTDGGFDVSFPVADLIAGGLPVPAVWDLYLTGESDSGPARLRAGRQLDDIKGKKNIMVFPAQPVAASGTKARVKPYYTIKDNLSVECLPDKA